MNATAIDQPSMVHDQLRTIVSSSFCEGENETEELPTFYSTRIRIKVSVQEPEIPQDFFDALEDERLGRLVALDEALNDEPTK